MGLGQISMADSPKAKQSLKRFEGLVKQYLASEKDLVVRWSAKSVWVAEVFYKGRDEIGVIDLSLPLELQFYQLGQQIDKLKDGIEAEQNTPPDPQHGREPETKEGFLVIHRQSGDVVDVVYVKTREDAEIHSCEFRDGDDSYDFECVPMSLIDAIPLSLRDADIGPPYSGSDRKWPDKVKPLAQYLAEYFDYELVEVNTNISGWRELLEQALDAYQSTENVTIKIERV